jgi:hypothetical protein
MRKRYPDSRPGQYWADDRRPAVRRSVQEDTDAGVVLAEWTFDFVVSEAVPRSAGVHLRFRGASVFEPEPLWRTLSR